MPSRKRDQLKRMMGYVLGSIEKAQIRMLELKEVFEPVEPSYALLADLTLQTLEVADMNARAFAQHAWGSVPDKVERWTQTGQDWYKRRRLGQEFAYVYCNECEIWVSRDKLGTGQLDDASTLYYTCPSCGCPLLATEEKEKAT